MDPLKDPNFVNLPLFERLRHQEGLRRIEALYATYKRIPPADQLTLNKKASMIAWLLPDVQGEFGAYFPANAYTSKCIFLSPMLEIMPIESCIAVAAEELAHAYFDHTLDENGTNEDRLEKQAEAKVLEWGFKKECDFHKSYLPIFHKWLSNHRSSELKGGPPPANTTQ